MIGNEGAGIDHSKVKAFFPCNIVPRFKQREAYNAGVIPLLVMSPHAQNFYYFLLLDDLIHQPMLVFMRRE